MGEILINFSRIQEYHLTNGYCLFPSEMAHYNQAMYLTLGKYSSYFVDWAGKIKNLSRRGQNEEVKMYAKNSIYCHPVVLGKSLAHIPWTLANFTLVYYRIARHLSIHRHRAVRNVLFIVDQKRQLQFLVNPYQSQWSAR